MNHPNKSAMLAPLLVGDASRYIRPRWHLPNNKISTEAFDLRDSTPPEEYVSHFLIDGNSTEEILNNAYAVISKKVTCQHDSSIAIIKISEALENVNDEPENPLIAFHEKGLPHCGLIYLTKNQESIQEAKATLCLLASRIFKRIQLRPA